MGDREANRPSSGVGNAGAGACGEASAPVPAAGQQPRGATTKRIASETLFAGAAEVQITHHGTAYRLRRTALGKLILTK